MFPYLDFQHCINKAIDTYKNDLFVYGTPKEVTIFNSSHSKTVGKLSSVHEEDNIFITSGVQQALAILTSISFPNENETILVEQPTYHLYMNI